MSTYITEIQVSLNKTEESQFKNQGLTRIYNNLKEGAGGNDIYLWYKKGNSSPITRIQFSFDNNTSEGLKAAKYKRVEKNLATSGDPIYLWYNSVSSVPNVKITDLDVSTDPVQAANHMTDGWEPLVCHLTQNSGGKSIYLWVKREKPTYIKEITATKTNTGDSQLFQSGYIRLDENINRGTDGKEIFLWYLPTIDPTQTIKDLQVSVNKSQYDNDKKQGYVAVDQDLNEGTGGNQIYLFYKKPDSSKKPIQSLILISNPTAVKPFQTAGVTVINKNLHSGNGSVQTLLLAFYQPPQVSE